jgi:hypothetical protein
MFTKSATHEAFAVRKFAQWKDTIGKSTTIIGDGTVALTLSTLPSTVKPEDRISSSAESLLRKSVDSILDVSLIDGARSRIVGIETHGRRTSKPIIQSHSLGCKYTYSSESSSLNIHDETW